MFNKDFYPTPEKIILKMVKKSRILNSDMRVINLLEPSAGKGNIVDFIENKYNKYYTKKIRIDVIEKDEQLLNFLTGKKYKIVSNDFLEFQTNKHYDLIIMNPPFSDVEDHILKAFEILQNGELITLLDTNTLNKNTFKANKIKEILRNNDSEVISLGNCFSNSERNTNVEVSMIYINKKSEKITSMFEGLDFENKDNSENYDFENNYNISKRDVVKNEVEKYNALLSYMFEFFTIIRKINSLNILKSKYFVETLSKYDVCKNNTDDLIKEFLSFRNEIDEDVKNICWESIFKRTGIERLLTNNTRNEIEKLKNEQKGIDFTENNIYTLLDILFQNQGKILESCVLEIFDKLTKYYKENRVHFEGWKTNDSWKVNRKFILPNIVTFDNRWGGSWSVSYSSNTNDIDRCMCFLSGKDFNEIDTIYKTLTNDLRYKGTKKGWGDYIESEFFKIKYFKKGTAHFIFKDEWLWHKFNIVACQGKNWLPKGKSDKEYIKLLGE